VSAYDRLNPRQQKFVDAFLELGNATRAAERAGYSPRSARNQASRMMTYDDIQAAIAERRAPIVKAAAEALGVTSLSVIEEFAAIAFVDPRKIASWSSEGVTLTPSDLLSEADARAVASVTQIPTKDGGIRVGFKLHDKTGALKDLADRLGIDKAEIERLYPTN
jgi:phage terminase small subunit